MQDGSEGVPQSSADSDGEGERDSSLSGDRIRRGPVLRSETSSPDVRLAPSVFHQVDEVRCRKGYEDFLQVPWPRHWHARSFLSVALRGRSGRFTRPRKGFRFYPCVLDAEGCEGGGLVGHGASEASHLVDIGKNGLSPLGPRSVPGDLEMSHQLLQELGTTTVIITRQPGGERDTGDGGHLVRFLVLHVRRGPRTRRSRRTAKDQLAFVDNLDGRWLSHVHIVERCLQLQRRASGSRDTGELSTS